MSSVQSCRNSAALTNGIRGRFSDDKKGLLTMNGIASNSPDNSSTECPYPTYSRVFIMAQYDDTQIGQFMQESLPRLVYHLDFLLANPDIKIQFGFTKKAAPPKNVLPHAYVKFLGKINVTSSQFLAVLLIVTSGVLYGLFLQFTT